jgi:two-component system, LuxR family, sensor kinase FixL
MESAKRRVASACAAALPVRVSVAAFLVGAGMAAGLFVEPFAAHEFTFPTYYFPVEISPLSGAVVAGFVAAAGNVLLSHLPIAPLSSFVRKLGRALFFIDGASPGPGAETDVCSAARSLVSDHPSVKRSFPSGAEARGEAPFENGSFITMIGAFRNAFDEKAAPAGALHEHALVSEQLASVALAAPGVVVSFYIAPNGRVAYRYASPKARLIFGIDQRELCVNPSVFCQRIRKTDLARQNESLSLSMREFSLWVADFLFDHPQKGMVWIEAQAAPVREPDGLVVWHGYASDITARKNAELSLSESAERLQATIDAAQDAVLTMGECGRILSVNRAGAQMFGYDAQEIIGIAAERLFDFPAGMELRPTSAAKAKPATERREIEGRRKGGASFPAELTLATTTLERKRLIVFFVKDLTEQRQIQRQMEELHRNRLDLMGGLAAALAHEINQPIAANATYLRVARRMLEKSPQSGSVEVLEVIDKATSQALRAGRIVMRLKALVRRGEPDKTLLSLHELVREVYSAIIADGSAASVEVTLSCVAGKDRIIADRIQLRQVFDSLVKNAIEAMQAADARALEIATSNPDGKTIRVDIIDTGRGLPESSGDDCFELFKSTKAKGMGVGLSISRSIIEAHYGRISATPNPAGGAIFSFSLPLQEPGFNS